jgi:hypothetical protein
MQAKNVLRPVAEARENSQLGLNSPTSIKFAKYIQRTRSTLRYVRGVRELTGGAVAYNWPIATQNVVLLSHWSIGVVSGGEAVTRHSHAEGRTNPNKNFSIPGRSLTSFWGQTIIDNIPQSLLTHTAGEKLRLVARGL